MTSYQTHATLNHKTSRYSPDGYTIIEECDVCGQRWEHNPSFGYPITLATMAEINRRRDAIARSLINAKRESA